MILKHSLTFSFIIFTLLLSSSYKTKANVIEKEKTLSHQFTSSQKEITDFTKNPPPNKVEIKKSAIEKKNTLSHRFTQLKNEKIDLTITEVKKTKLQYFKSLGHSYKDPNFRRFLHNKVNNNSENRLLAQQYISSLGHTFPNSALNKSVQGKRLNNKSTEQDDNSSSGFLENEELLLIAQVGNDVLDTVFGYKSGNGAMIGLDNLFSVIDFPIIVNPLERTASGWFINESQSFELSVPNDGNTPALVLINGQTYQIPRHLIRVEDDDIYLHSSYLSDIFNIGFEVNFKDLLLLISPSQLLPLQEKLRRRARLGKLSIGQLLPPELPFRDTPYKVFSIPFIDAQTSYSVSNNINRANYSLLGMGDLAYMTGSYFLNGNDDKLVENFRLNLQRESINKSLLGPLKASKIAFGDISPTNIPLLKGAPQEVGFRIANREVGINKNLNTTSFVGDLLPGWDIELYHNKRLLETVTVDESGRYEFLDLDLSFGENIFKMIFYGPQGQKSERIESVPVITNTLLDNQLTYDLSVTKQNSSLFMQKKTNFPLINSYRTALALEQGINNDLSIQSGLSTYQFRNGERHNFLPFSVNYYLPIAKLNLGYVKDLDAGSSLRFSAKSRINKHAINLNYQQSDKDFTIDSHFITNNKNNVSLGFSGPLHADNGLSLRYSLNSSNSSSYNNIDTSTVNLFIGAFTNRFSLTNTLNKINIAIPNNTNIETFNGTTQFTKTFDSMRWRSQIGYKVEPKVELINASTSLFWAMSPKFSSEFGLHYNQNTTRASYSLNWDTQYAIVSGNVSVDDNSNYQAFLSLRFSFGQDPTSGDLRIARDRMATNGGISARVFEDINLDGRYNKGEPLIEGAKLIGVHARRDAYSKESGIAFLTGLPKNRITDVKLDVDSLENPFWVPVEKGFSFLPRPGSIEVFDIPVVTAGEIEGTISLTRDDKQIPGRYIPLQILDDKGEIVLETESEYDGFYLFGAVTPGDYTVIINPDYLKNNKLSMATSQQATIYGDGTIVRGLDFTLQSNKVTSPPIINNNNSEQGSGIYVINLGGFASSFNRQLTYRLLLKQYPKLRILGPIEDQSIPNKLLLGPLSNPNNYIELCQTIVAKGLHCSIEQQP
jgi:hypothetical protein